MWRKCDFHRHTTPDASGEFNFDARDFLFECVRDGLDVVAVTDHDQTDHIDAVVAEAANHDITVVPGVEISTDRGHILALSPEGKQSWADDPGRVMWPHPWFRFADSGVRFPPPVKHNRLTGVLSEQRANRAGLFRNGPCSPHRSPCG